MYPAGISGFLDVCAAGDYLLAKHYSDNDPDVDVISINELRLVAGFKDSYLTFAVHPEGRLVACSTGGVIHNLAFVDLDSLYPCRDMYRTKRFITDIQFGPRGDMLAVRGYFLAHPRTVGYMKVLAFPEMKQRYQINWDHHTESRGIAFSATGDRLFIPREDGVVAECSALDGKLQAEYALHDEPIVDIALDETLGMAVTVGKSGNTILSRMAKRSTRANPIPGLCKAFIERSGHLKDGYLIVEGRETEL